MKKSFLWIAAALIAVSACNKNGGDSDIKDLEAKKYLYSAMNQYYYWYKHIPEKIDATPDIFDIFTNMLYLPKDRWSWMTTVNACRYSQEGVSSSSYGMSLAQGKIYYYKDYSVKVRYIYEGSPLYSKGVRRGWTLTHLNGTPVMELIRDGKFEEVYSRSSNSFTFTDLEGESLVISASQSVVYSRSYLARKVFTSDDFPGLQSPVGYFNYHSFNVNMEEEDVDGTFEQFKAQGIKDLIIDLRYNGGGNVSTAVHIAGWLAPASAHGKIFCSQIYNDKIEPSSSDTAYIKRNKNAFDLEHLIIIGGGSTASASELLINGLRPLMGNVKFKTIGDTTYGKPNGMFAFAYPEGGSQEKFYDKADYVFLPICFYTVNSEGFGGYEDGLVPDLYYPERINSDWDAEEDLIHSSLNYIATGSFIQPVKPQKSPASQRDAFVLDAKLGEENAPGYGLMFIPATR